jgi:hypothetical protein
MGAVPAPAGNTAQGATTDESLASYIENIAWLDTKGL